MQKVQTESADDEQRLINTGGELTMSGGHRVPVPPGDGKASGLPGNLHHHDLDDHDVVEDFELNGVTQSYIITGDVFSSGMPSPRDGFGNAHTEETTGIIHHDERRSLGTASIMPKTFPAVFGKTASSSSRANVDDAIERPSYGGGELDGAYTGGYNYTYGGSSSSTSRITGFGSGDPGGRGKCGGEKVEVLLPLHMR